MKKSTLFIFLAFIVTSAYAQKELWGYKMANDGMIIKVPLEGIDQEPEVMHTFDPTGILGKFPKIRLLEASNGKLYGITSYDGGGQGVPKGVLFEYDTTLSTYRVLANTVINSYQGNLFGLIEPVPGWLYGTTNGGNSIFKYNIETEEISVVASIPPFNYNNSQYYPRFNGELMKASDGNLYGVTSMAPSSQNVPYPGGIYRLNIATGQITKIYVFGVNGSDIQYPVYGTKLIEALPGKLYGTAMGGEHVGPEGVAPLGSGTLYEYTIATNTMVKKFDFDYNTIGSDPSPLIKSDNKLYGTLTGFVDSSNNLPNEDGSIFEYNLDTQSLTLLHSFDFLTDDQVKSPNGLLLKGTDGNLYGNSIYGNYKFDMATYTVSKKINSVTPFDSQTLIEICRKPSYSFFETAAVAICPGTPFAFDLQNTNATEYVWKKGSVILVSQTTGILSIENPTQEDTGIYTCTMVNECGTTVTMPLQLTVECLGLDEAISKDAVKLYPNPAANILNVKLPDTQSFEVQSIVISNMLGQNVYRTDKTTNIDISSLSPGMYQVSLATDKGNWYGKFIKE